MDNIPIRKNPSGQEEINPNLSVPPEVMAQLKKDAEAAGQRLSVEGNTASDDVDVLHEEFDLPSRGYFYSEGHPLSSGKIKIKYMTAQEEDILSSENLIKKGVVLDYLLERLVVTPGVTVNDLLLTDKNAVFIYARQLAYGDEFKGTTKCPACGAENEIVFDLSQLKFNEFDFSKYPKGINEFEFVLPKTKKTLRYKLLDSGDEQSIKEELKAISRFDKSGKSPEVTTRLKKMILSVDGNTDKNFIKKFVDNLPAQESLAFRKHIGKNTPSLDLRFNFECEECGHAEEMPLPIDVSFFWPES